MSIGRLEREWLTYAERIVPQNAPPVQKQETKRAFYAGAAAFENAMQSLLGPGEEPTDAEVNGLEAIHEEIRRFVADVARGKA